MKSLFITLFCYFSTVFSDYSIVFIHIGDKAPSYAATAIVQARLFNPNANIFFVSSEKALKELVFLQDEHNIQLNSYENIKKSDLHLDYDKRCTQESPFWRYTSERFLYLWDFMEAYSLENVFHLENDNMLYANLELFLSQFQRYYPNIAATFDNEDRCIPGFVWIANCPSMESLARYFTLKANEKKSDMEVLGSYRKDDPEHFAKTLPIIMSDYNLVYPLESPHHHKTNTPERYSNNENVFQGIFDAAAIGQFLGGIDPIHANNQPGFINESCLFNPSFLEYKWLADNEGRLIPYAIFRNKMYKIFNLHIHSKRLNAFRSLE